MARFDITKYDDVNSRIDKFWTDFPNGSIITDMVWNGTDFEEVVFKVSIWKDRSSEGRPDATGTAAEKRGQSSSDGANLTHHVENAETSAIGRALANMNYKCKKDSPRPSQQEMSRTTMAQEQNKPNPNDPFITPEQRGKLNALRLEVGKLPVSEDPIKNSDYVKQAQELLAEKKKMADNGGK